MKDRWISIIKKCTNILNNRDGIALIATLILGIIAISFTLTMVYLAKEGTRAGGIEGRYQAALQAAKGGAEIMIDYINHFDDTNPPHSMTDLKPSTSHLCSNMIFATDSCSDNKGTHYYPDSGTTCTSTIGRYNVTVRITNSDCKAQGSGLNQQCVCFHSITSQAVAKDSSKEKASVDVLYKVTY